MGNKRTDESVFPAHAGMSPGEIKERLVFFRFPRTRGDEPINEITEIRLNWFSPHTRG